MYPHLPKKGQGQTHKLLDEAKNDVNLQWIYDWVHAIYNGSFKVLQDTLALRPPDVWEKYSLLGITDLAEQALLKTAQEKFRTEWRTTYPYRPKAKQNVHSKATSGITLRMPHPGIFDRVPDAPGSGQPDLLPTES